MRTTFSGRYRIMENKIIIIGAGAAGLSAALELARNGISSLLISDMPSERAQSVMAEGGINAALHEETDSPELHAKETLHAGRNIADEDAVNKLTEAAPDIIKNLFMNGMAFTLNEEKEADVRAFGGQSVKRTFYAASNTGKQLMHTLIDQARRFEADGMIARMTGWLFLRLLSQNNTAYGCELIHSITQEKKVIYGKIIIASGGLGGMFGNATGSVRNKGAVSANLFTSGVRFANGEFIQYHPTTVKLHRKNMLITEAVRGEGGRLYVLQEGKPYYFMEEKYPERGNLMPRDVIAREEWAWIQKGCQIYLTMQHLDKKVQTEKLKGVVEDCMEFLGINLIKEPIPVEPGIHYFMGGIWVDAGHRTSMKNLYAAGECACQYHGANRLGGNSLLGALYGGKIAAKSVIRDSKITEISKSLESPECLELQKDLESPKRLEQSENLEPQKNLERLENLELSKNLDLPDSLESSEAMGIYKEKKVQKKNIAGSYMDNMQQLHTILQQGLGIIRNEKTLQDALEKINQLIEKIGTTYDETATELENQSLADCCILGKAMLLCADARKESRGAHTRSDYPRENDSYEKQTIAELINGEIHISFQKAGKQYED